MLLRGEDIIIRTVKQMRPDMVAIYPHVFNKMFIWKFSRYDNRMREKLVAGKDSEITMDICMSAAINGKRVIGIVEESEMFALRREIKKISCKKLSMVMLVLKEYSKEDKYPMMPSVGNDLDWIRICVANGQELHDFLIMSVPITEEAHLPVMLIMDGIVADRVSEVKIIEDDEQVREFVNKFKVNPRWKFCLTRWQN
ncbi:MAG: hypothetical protein KKC11_03100 [Candidatus Omnitrophica bacterium]|nr:hypothetical protein [Candidatus Omnitrophota bacterium]MBU1133451.1 hypothetical protein [Candidatus Omnitrophota bacterium]MBU2437166.1 hypothetical protein [Candidatus Omnitrophota bacterium]MBU2504844.1 hypothetical protein [Candidatus Omnitrophota bacterium]